LGRKLMALADRDILVLEDDILLGQLLCNMIRMYRIGLPHLSLSEVDACQMMRERDFHICFLGLRLRTGVCERAVALANAKRIPTLLMADAEGLEPLSIQPQRGLVVQKPASEEMIRDAAAALLMQEAVR